MHRFFRVACATAPCAAIRVPLKLQRRRKRLREGAVSDGARPSSRSPSRDFSTLFT